MIGRWSLHLTGERGGNITLDLNNLCSSKQGFTGGIISTKARFRDTARDPPPAHYGTGARIFVPSHKSLLPIPVTSQYFTGIQVGRLEEITQSVFESSQKAELALQHRHPLRALLPILVLLLSHRSVSALQPKYMRRTEKSFSSR